MNITDLLNLFSFPIGQVWSEYEHFEAPIFLTNFSEITFLTRELRACARASYRYDVGNAIRSLARLIGRFL